jgi:hypothetical protein
VQKRHLVICALIATVFRGILGSDFTVVNANMSGLGSLAQAITDANAHPGADRIVFNIPGAGVHTIDVSRDSLPSLTESLVIDGYSQPGAKPNSLTVGDDAVILIRVDGGADSNAGLVFYGASADYTVRGLCLTGFGEPYGIVTGVAISAALVHSAVIAGNFIGVLPDGETARGNDTAVGHVTQLGGTDPASRNVISGNDIGFSGEAYPAPGTTAFGAVVQGNYIGTNASGTKAIPNLQAIALETFQTGMCGSGDVDLSNTSIGGTATGAGNLISGNTAAIDLGRYECGGGRSTPQPVRANGVRIQGNMIGVQADGVSPLPNTSGISIRAGADNIIGGLEAGAGNVISFNDSGVIVGDTAVFDPANLRNRILSNAIYANRIGIDLNDDGATPNDPGDSDAGPNNYQNSPVIQSTDIVNGSVTIKGTLNSAANTQFTLQYFSESLDRPQRIQTYLGSSPVTTDADGNAQFSATFPVKGANLAFNMTATSQDGNTSEFARNAPRLRNISTRVLVERGDEIAIVGFIVRRSTPVGQVVIRALGSSLQSVVAPLPDPTLELYDAKGTLIASNDNWRDDPNAEYVGQAGLAPMNDLEPALSRDLPEGSYTAVVRGAGGATGVTLVEAYDVAGRFGEPVNISTRGLVGTGDNVMIAGTVIEQVTGSSRIVARALGPSLATAGVTDPLADPTLELHDSQGTIIDSNDNWRDGQPDALAAVDLTPSSDSESAIFTQLTSGAYTAIVRGSNDTTGVALVELYNLH